ESSRSPPPATRRSRKPSPIEEEHSDEAVRTSARTARRHRRCAVGRRGVGRDLASVTSLGRRPNVKASYLRIATAEPALNASAPRSLKPHLRPIFSFVNLLIADFDKVGWQPAGMAQYFPKLLPRAEAVTPHLHVVDAYLKGTCKL